MVVITMYDSEATHAITEELKNLRTLVRRFGIYFVVLSLLPFVWAILCLMVMGATVGGLFGGIGGAMTSLAPTVPAAQVKTASKTPSQQEQQILELAYALERLQDQIKQGSQLPRTPSGQILYPGPSAPPKFPAGVKFVPDDDNPKGFKPVIPGK